MISKKRLTRALSCATPIVEKNLSPQAADAVLGRMEAFYMELDQTLPELIRAVCSLHSGARNRMA